MADQPNSTGRKRRGPLPTGKGVTVGARLQPPFVKALDRYIAQHGGSITRAGAVREILAEYFGLKDAT